MEATSQVQSPPLVGLPSPGVELTRQAKRLGLAQVLWSKTPLALGIPPAHHGMLAQLATQSTHPRAGHAPTIHVSEASLWSPPQTCQQTRLSQQARRRKGRRLDTATTSAATHCPARRVHRGTHGSAIVSAVHYDCEPWGAASWLGNPDRGPHPRSPLRVETVLAPLGQTQR